MVLLDGDWGMALFVGESLAVVEMWFVLLIRNGTRQPWETEKEISRLGQEFSKF